MSAILLKKSGFAVTLIEKKQYPFHKVCGEYISNEVRPFLESIGLDINELGAKNISKFRFTSPSGKALDAPLDLGGFGISRYVIDQQLFLLAKQIGVEFLLGKSAENIDFNNDEFNVQTTDNEQYIAKLYP